MTYPPYTFNHRYYTSLVVMVVIDKNRIKI